MSNFQKFCVACVACGGTTSKAYARAHAGQCKSCVTGLRSEATARQAGDHDSRNARLIDSGWQAYAREEGHYDQGDY